jgi:protein SHQ1
LFFLDLIEEYRPVYMGLFDILLAYCYNRRTTEGENTIESAWTICTLSSSLSWLEHFSNLQQVLESFYRRSLTYPLYRHFQLSSKVVEDVIAVLNKGRKSVLKCFLEVKTILDHHETRYLLSMIYLDDYCHWVQRASDRLLSSLADKIQESVPHKSDMPWPLEAYEALAVEAESERECVSESPQ